MMEHSLHVGVMVILSFAIFFVLFKDRFQIKSKLAVCSLLTLILFAVAFVLPCHQINPNDHLAQNDSGQHACCVIKTDVASAVVHIDIGTVSFQPDVILKQNDSSFVLLNNLNNKSPPLKV